MSEELQEGVRRIVERTMRESHGRAVAVLVGQLRDFDLAEEAVQDAWVEAVRTWGRDGPPDNPIAWIVATVATSRLTGGRSGSTSSGLVSRSAISAR